MFILVDFEWIELKRHKKEITQLSALRVDKHWDTEEEFHRLAFPSNPNNTNWSHAAFNGYDKIQFLAAGSERHCITDFFEWLHEDDVLCVWSSTAKRVLIEEWKRILKKPLENHVYFANDTVYSELDIDEPSRRGLHQTSAECGVASWGPPCCAKNDVQVLQELLKALSITPEKILEFKKIERNAKFVANQQYHYFYSPTSKVFHSRNCYSLLRANVLEGCVYYKTASKGRTPCKICNPMPEPEVKQKEKSPQQIRQELAAQQSLQRFRLFDGTVIETYPNKIIGCCHSKIHPGKMTRRLLEEHECLKKNCRHFEKYRNSTYWDALREQNKAKEREKEKKQQAKAERKAHEDLMINIRNEIQTYADECDYDIDIISVREERTNVFTVFYVSDNRYADGKLYMELEDIARQKNRPWKFLLRHIKNEDGQFVTIEEFYARKRA